MFQMNFNVQNVCVKITESWSLCLKSDNTMKEMEQK